MNEIKEKYLPVGTVVLLKNGKKRVMITGFCVTPQGKDEAYDYSGCLYPEGFLSSNQNCLFNHSQIEKVFHMGLIDEEEIKFKEQLKSLIEMADQFSKFKDTDNNQQDSNDSKTVTEESNLNEEIEKEEVVNETTEEDKNEVNEEIQDNNNQELDNDSTEIETLDDFVS